MATKTIMNLDVKYDGKIYKKGAECAGELGSYFKKEGLATEMDEQEWAARKLLAEKEAEKKSLEAKRNPKKVVEE